jgi:Ca2+-binding RTX toxin-like protein
MEKCFAEPYTQLGLYTDPQGSGAGDDLTTAWQHIFLNVKAELLTQAGADAIYGGTISYDSTTGTFTGDMALSSDTISALQAAAPTDTTAHTASYWEQVAEYIAFTKGFTSLTGGEVTMLDNAITATDATLSWTFIETHSVPDWVGVSIGAGPDDDTLYGTYGNDNLDGGAGNDTIYGNYNGTGNDILHGGTGNDLIYGSADSSQLYGDDGNDTLTGGNGGDTLDGGAGNDTITGGSGNDTITGGDGNDTIYGGYGDDSLTPGAGGNFVYGGGGDDTYNYGGGVDVYNDYGGGGTDTIQLPSGVALGDLTFTGVMETGSSVMDLLITDSSGLSIQIADFASGSSILSNIETLTFADTSTHALNDFTALTIYGSDGNDTISSLYTSQYIDSTIHAGGGNDYIALYGGNNTIDGGPGNDTMFSGTGNDTYIASPGFDTISYDSGGSDVIVMPDGITADDVHLLRHSDAPYDLQVTIDGLGQIDIQSQFYGSYQIEQIQFSDSSTLDLTTHQIETVGTSGNDYMTGITYGGNTDNIFDGRAGDDTMVGGSGDDTYIVSPGLDTVHESSGGTDTLQYGDGVNFEDLTFSPSGTYDLNIALHAGVDEVTVQYEFYGNSDFHVENLQFADGFHLDLSAEASWQSVSGTYSAGNGGETDIGSSGADTITGGTGDDAIVGMAGNDTLHGGDGADQLRGGDGSDTLYGDAGNDVLWGNAGADTLSGGNGNDTISGGDGADTLTGGSGADTFVFRQGETGSDTITDFSTTDGDKLDFHDILIGFNPLTSAITDFVHVTASGSDAIVSVDADGPAGGAANFVAIATLTGMSALAGTEADLLANGNLIAHM